jgi:protein TonB
MEALVKEVPNSKYNRREGKSKNEGPKKLKDKNNFVLSKKDYTDFINIKSDKKKKLEDRETLYFFIGLNITLIFLIIVFNWKFYDDGSLVTLDNLENSSFEDMQEIPLTEQPPPPPPNILRLPTIIEVSDEVLIEQIDVDMDVEITEEMAIEETIFSDEPLEEELVDEIFDIVEVWPEYKGGIKAFYSFVFKNIKYPNSARRLRIEGKVFLKFVVDKDGTITQSEIIKGIHTSCDNEALRVLNMSPKWKPGKQRGKPVMVKMILPITYKLAEI